MTGDHPSKCHCCVNRSRKASNITFARILGPVFGLLRRHRQKGAVSGGSSSKAARTYTPALQGAVGATSSTTTPVPGGANTSNTAASNNENNNGIQTQGSHSTAQSTATQKASARVIFGVQGVRRSLEIEQLGIFDDTNDRTFFSELKTQYKKHRSYFGRFVSPFCFQHCNFVKVSPLKPSTKAYGLILLVPETQR